MKVTLISKPDKQLRPITQILLNRGIAPENIKAYITHTTEDINEPAAFGEEILKRGARMLLSHISTNDDIFIVVDADCDGFTSSALLINYLHCLFPAYVENHVKWFIHGGKQHGLSDCIDLAKKYKMVICPDSGR